MIEKDQSQEKTSSQYLDYIGHTDTLDEEIVIDNQIRAKEYECSTNKTTEWKNESELNIETEKIAIGMINCPNKRNSRIILKAGRKNKIHDVTNQEVNCN